MTLFPRFIVALFVALALSSSSPGLAVAGWPQQGSLVGDNAGIQYWPSLCPDQSGGLFISWFSGVGASSALFLQAYAPDGSIRNGWPSAGLLVKSLPYPPSNPLYLSRAGFGVVSDLAGGAYVLWPDRNSNDDVEFRLIHVNGNVQVASGWPVSGLAVVDTVAYQGGATLIGDGDGGVMVAWSDYIDGDLHVRVQRYDSGGQIHPGWPARGARPNGGYNSQEKPVLSSDGSGGAWVGWIHSGSPSQSFSPSSIDYVRALHHVMANGEIDPALPAGGLRLGGYDVYAEMGLVADQSGGVLASWNGSNAASSYGMFVQRISPGGAPAPGWPPYGVRYSNNGSDHDDHAVTTDGQGGVLSAWGTYEPANGRVMTRVQRIRGDGSTPPGWDVAGVPLGFMAEFVREPLPVTDQFGGAVVVWPDSASGGGEVDLFARRVLSTGATLPSVDQPPVAVCTAPGTQGSCRAISDGSGGAYVAWVDQRNDEGDIYVRRILPENFVAGAQAGGGGGEALMLAAPRPNPFQDRVELGFTLPRSGRVTAEIIDISGRRRKLLERGDLDAGPHTLTWDGSDDQGRRVRAGFYGLVVRCGNETVFARLLRFK